MVEERSIRNPTGRGDFAEHADNRWRPGVAFRAPLIALIFHSNGRWSRGPPTKRQTRSTRLPAYSTARSP